MPEGVANVETIENLPPGWHSVVDEETGEHFIKMMKQENHPGRHRKLYQQMEKLLVIVAERGKGGGKCK